MKAYKTLFLSDKSHHLLACFALLYLALHQGLFYLALIGYIFRLKGVYLKAFLLIISLCFVLRITLLNQRQSVLEEGLVDLNVRIESVNYKEQSTQIFASYRNERVLIRVNTRLVVIPGEVYQVKGSAQKPLHQTKPHDFDYATYLSRQNVYVILTDPTLTYIGKQWHIGQIRQAILGYFDAYEGSSSDYLATLLLGEKSLDPELNKELSLLGISHLFAISGLHIALIALYLSKILNQIFREKASSRLLSLFLLFYIVITGFLASVFRAAGILILKQVANEVKIMITPLDCVSLIAAIVLLYNPYSLYQAGFQLSFLVSISYVVYASFISQKTDIVGLTKLTVLAQAMTLPVVLTFSSYVNFLSVIVNPFLIMFFTTLFLPFTFMVLLSVKLAPLYQILISAFENWVYFLGRINGLTVSLPPMKPTQILLYYVSVALVLVALETKKLTIKQGISLSILACSFWIIGTIRPFHQVIVFDVNQGSSALVSDKFGRCDALIDHHHTVYEVLPKLGISKLDALFISHGHFDHYGDLHALLSRVKVKAVYLNAYETHPHILSAVKNIPIYYLRQGDQVFCGDLVFNILNPVHEFENINNNSLVIKVDIGGLTWLFPGDIEKEAEANLVMQDIKSDVLVLPHHGSNTSSTSNFLRAVNPRLAIASAGRNNKFGFVHQDVHRRLLEMDLVVRSTQVYGTLVFNTRFQTLWVTSYSPYESGKKKWRFDTFLCII